MKRRCMMLLVCFAMFTMLTGQMVYAEGPAVPILLYHNIAESYDPAMRVLHCTPAEFEEHMTALQTDGYTTITFQQYYDYVTNGAPLPPKPIIVCFDDGYTSNYTYAFPILKRLGMQATIFAITGRMGATDTDYPHFTWEQAREMEESGVIDIESHTNLHLNLEELDVSTAVYELRISYYMLAQELGKTPLVLAYPYGLRSAETAQLATEAGFAVQCLVGDSGVNRKEDGLTALRRLSVSGGMRGQDVLDMIADNMAQ